MNSVLGIDPGSSKSAFILWDNKTILEKGILPNEEIIDLLDAMWREPITLAIESMVHITHGGKAIVDTLLWAGQFYHAWQGNKEFVPVGNVRMALCGTMRSDDVAVRKVLIQRFGEPGSKKNPGLTYGLGASGYHLWRAFGVAVFWMDHMEFQGRELK